MKIARMNPFESTSKTKAFFDLETGDNILIKGFTLVDGPNGLFVSAPQEKGKDNKYYEKVVIPQEMRGKLSELAISKYNEMNS